MLYFLLIHSKDLCDGRGIYHNGKCYLTKQRSSRNCSTFMEADAYCTSEGAGLPILSSEDDSLFIHEYLQHQQKQQNSSNYIWLNMKRSTSNRWQWRDGSPLKLNKWILGEPSNKSTGHNCATVTKKGINTGWKTENCSAYQDTVCQKGRFFLSFEFI